MVRLSMANGSAWHGYQLCVTNFDYGSYSESKLETMTE